MRRFCCAVLLGLIAPGCMSSQAHRSAATVPHSTGANGSAVHTAVTAVTAVTVVPVAATTTSEAGAVVSDPGPVSTSALRDESTSLSMGDTAIAVVTHRSGSSPVVFVNVHDDENTAVKAGLDYLKHHSGTLIELRHDGHRNITFTVGQNSYHVDPNRMFTTGGLEANLKKLNNTHTSAVNAAVSRFAQQLLAMPTLAQAQAVVALHNNKLFEGLSVRSYRSGGSEARNASMVTFGDGSTHDFFLVTQPSVFADLKKLKKNAVLQSPQAFDDGSLSIWFASQKRPYVNVEALSTDLKEQTRMIASAVDVLSAHLQD